MKQQATNGGRKNRSKPGNLREQIDPLMCQAYKDAQAEANWPTPTALNRVRDEETMEKCLKFRQGNGQTSVPLYLEEKVNLEEKSWLTPRANEPTTDNNFVARNADRGKHCHVSLTSQAKSLWPTITANTPDMESNGPNGHQGTYLAGAVKSWATPRANKVHPEITEDNRDHLANRNKSNLEEEIAGHCGKATGKLNPRWVETLMGLPVGWTMPSCQSPVTTVQTNSDCLETELSQQQQNELSELF
jgi:hypothetical protein